MATIELTGHINEQGQIELDQPTHLPAGEAVRVTIETLQELPYDDDPEWNASLAKSLDVLQRLADKARKDHEEGRTMPLDPEQL
jgi:hypothetical protein